MPHGRAFNRSIGAAAVVAALLAIALWVPLDTTSGVFEKVRRQVVIGDALAPTVALAFVGLGGLLLALRPDEQGGVGRRNLGYLALLLLGLLASLLVMRWAGPAALALFGTEGAEYRLLRATPPWKYIGFALGGALLVGGLISLIERRVTMRAAVIAICAVAAMIAVYDLPFDDLLLPPNGDV